MEQPGDYCITYNGALVQKAADGSTVAQTALSYDDFARKFFQQHLNAALLLNPAQNGLIFPRIAFQKGTDNFIKKPHDNHL